MSRIGYAVGRRLDQLCTITPRVAGAKNADGRPAVTYADPILGVRCRLVVLAEVERLSAYQQRLRDHENALGLEANGARVVMSQRLSRL